MSDEGERAGQQIGNYQLTHLLGRGNFADVYLGQHVHLHTLAAIKVLHGRLTDDDLANSGYRRNRSLHVAGTTTGASRTGKRSVCAGHRDLRMAVRRAPF